MQDPIILDVLSYWENLRAGRLAPMRSELDPRQITGALDHTFVLEYNGPLDVRFRLAGMALCQMMGMELRGMPARALIETGHRDELSRVLDDLVVSPKIVEVLLKTSTNSSSQLNARMLLLPMQNDAGQFTRILGCLVSKGPTFQTPQRFEIAEVKTTRIIGTMGAPISERAQKMASGFAEDQLKFTGPTKIAKPKVGKKTTTPRLVAGKPYLRLVKDE